MKIKSFVLILILSSFLMVSCSIRHQASDPFYTSTGEWKGNIRFPLIKPYEVTYLELPEQQWIVDFHLLPTARAIYWYNGIGYVQKVTVEDGLILVYTAFKPYVAADVGQKVLNWFVIIPEKKIETGFDNEEDFLIYLRGYNIKEIIWENPDSIYQRYLRTGCLDWIPDCK